MTIENFQVKFLWNIVQIVAYFSILFYAFRKVARKTDFQRHWQLTVFFLFAVNATWCFITLFVIEDSNDAQYAALTWQETLVVSKRFTKCYQAVFATPARWFLSQQLLMATPALALWLFTASRRFAWNNALWYAVIGELAAISAASALALAGLSTLLTKRPFTSFVAAGYGRARVPRVPMSVAAALIAAALCVYATPAADAYSKKLFNVLLMVLHVLLLVPFLIADTADADADDDEARTMSRVARNWRNRSSLCLLYGVLAGIAIVSHWNTTLQVLESGESIWSALFAHHCQTSISIDAILVTVIGAAAMLRRQHGIVGVLLIPVFSIGGILPLFLAMEEWHFEKENHRQMKSKSRSKSPTRTRKSS